MIKHSGNGVVIIISLQEQQNGPHVFIDFSPEHVCMWWEGGCSGRESFKFRVNQYKYTCR